MVKKLVLLTPPSHSHRTAEENLGMEYLASSARSAGHNITMIDGWLLGLTTGEIINRVLKVPLPDLIGISCYVSSLEDVRQLIGALRCVFPRVPIIAGGYGPTFHPEEFLDVGCNYVLCGEAEYALLELLAALDHSESHITNIPGLIWRNSVGGTERNVRVVPVGNLDSLPFPARDSVGTTIALKNPVHLSTSRGCMAHCLFCSIVSFERTMRQAPSWRSRTIPNIVEEIYSLYHEFGVCCYKIVDDSFIEFPRDERWASDFAEALRRRNLSIRFRTQIRADRLTEGLVRSLVDAGWFATSVGIENGSASALRRMQKAARVDDNAMALDLLHKYGVYVQMGMILFDHETTMIELQENLDFLKSLRWPVTKGIFTEMFAAQGTPFTRLLARQGRIDSSKYGNHQYRRTSEEVETVYQALKVWHQSHAETYDHAINPISAPKNLPSSGYEAYHAVCLDLYFRDISFFEGVLRRAKNLPDLIGEFVREQIQESIPFFDRVRKELSVLDARYGLSYLASPNKFL